MAEFLLLNRPNYGEVYPHIHSLEGMCPGDRIDDFIEYMGVNFNTAEDRKKLLLDSDRIFHNLLDYAASHGANRICEYLVSTEFHGEIDMTFLESFHSIIHAIKNSKTETALILIASGVGSLQVRSYISTPFGTNAALGDFTTAILYGDAIVYTSLMERYGINACIQQVDSRGFVTPLWAAVRARNAYMVRRLLDAGAPADDRARLYGPDRIGSERDDEYQTASPIQIAIRIGNLEILEIFRRHGCDFSMGSNERWLPLLEAMKPDGPETPETIASIIETMRWLLAQGARINAATTTVNPLIFSMRFQSTEITEFLLRNGADPMAAIISPAGYVPRYSVINEPHEFYFKCVADCDITRLRLIDTCLPGFNFRATDRYNRTALIQPVNTWAPVFIDNYDADPAGPYYEIVNFLLDKGVSLEDFDIGGNTALHAVSSSSQRAMFDVLIALGANIDAVNFEGRRPARG
jgi:ankyrin repeat protein